MPIDRFCVIIYVLFWLVRINGCIRRGREPLLRGRDWFFNVRVPPDFYGGAGRAILHRYWMRMLIPFAVDIPFATAIFLSHRVSLLNWLILGLCALIHINHVFSVDLAERQARHFELADSERPVTCMVASLKRRRLRDYSSPKFECALALLFIIAFAWLIRYYLDAPGHHNLQQVFGVPAIFFYLQLGILLVKLLIVRWRSPVPGLEAAEHIEAREKARNHYLWTCDCYRTAAAAAILFWTIQLTTTASNLHRLVSIWLTAGIVIALVLTVWVEIKRKRLAAVALRASPVKLPDLLQQGKVAKWPICYERSVPMLVVKSAHGYSVNLANALNCLGAAYLVGLIVLFAIFRMGH